MFYFLGISISAELKVGIPSAQRVVTIGNILIPLLGKLAWGNLLQQGWKEGKHTTKVGGGESESGCRFRSFGVIATKGGGRKGNTGLGWDWGWRK